MLLQQETNMIKRIITLDEKDWKLVKTALVSSDNEALLKFLILSSVEVEEETTKYERSK